MKLYPKAYCLWQERSVFSAFLSLTKPSAEHIAVIDKHRRTSHAFWPVSEDCRNFPMALDEAENRLFIGCRNPSWMIVYDTVTGKPVSEVEIAGDDDIFLDAARKHVYVFCRAGFLQVFEAGGICIFRIFRSVALHAHLSSFERKVSSMSRYRAVLPDRRKYVS